MFGAIRLAVTRNPVCPIMRCSGRTASPSRCQPLTMLSQALGSAKWPLDRSPSRNLESWVTVATYPSTNPPGISALATVSMHSQGANMSNTTRSADPSLTTSGNLSCKSPRWISQFSGSRPVCVITFALAISANSSRRSKLSSLPLGPIARRRYRESAPEPTPASITLAQGRCRLQR